MKEAQKIWEMELLKSIGQKSAAGTTNNESVWWVDIYSNG